MKDGKKGNINLDRELPLNSNLLFHDECSGELVKLETILGDAYEDGKDTLRDFYWLCICNECNRKVKVMVRVMESNNLVVRKGEIEFE